MMSRGPVAVAYLHHLSAISGGETSLLGLWENLDRSRFRPVLLGPDEGPFVEAAKRLDVDCVATDYARLRELLSRRGRATIRDLQRRLHEVGAKLVHGNAPSTNAAATLAGRSGDRKLIWQQRTLPRPADFDFESRLGWLADRIICNSAAVARRYGCRDGNVTVIRNGVDTDRFRPGAGGGALRAEIGLAHDDVAIGIVGNFSPLKNHELFLDAAARLAGRYPEARFVIVGGEVFDDNRGRAAHLAKRIEDDDLRGSTLILGQRTDMPAVMDALDVVVGAARVEACSRALLEAMASGTAVVAAAAGGNHELVGPGSGILFRPDGAIELAHALEALIVDAPYRRRLGAAGRERALRHFRIENQARAVECVYATLLESP